MFFDTTKITMAQKSAAAAGGGPEVKGTRFGKKEWPKGHKGRAYAFTDFVCDKSFWEAEWAEDKADYLVIGEEICPSTGKKHYQGYINYLNPRAWSAIKKKFDGRFVEPAFASGKNNRDYCIEDGVFTEWGRVPQQGERTDLELVRQQIKEKTLAGTFSELLLAEEHFDKYCQYGKPLLRYQQLVEPKRDWVTMVICRWGPSGTGKSHVPMEKGAVPVRIGGDRYNPFIMGYNGEDVVVFNDFNPDSCDLAWMLDVCDRYKMEANVKGSSRNWKPRVVYFTSNTDPLGWWKVSGEMSVEHHSTAWARRINKIVHCTDVYVQDQKDMFTQAELDRW